MSSRARRRWSSIVSLGIVLSGSGGVWGQETASEPEVGVPRDVVGVSVVRRRVLQSEEVLTSVSVLRGVDIANLDVNEPLDLVRRVPGAYTEQFNQGIISSEVGIRGFNTQGELPSLKLLIDGIPSNLHIGSVDMKPIFPMEIERMELIRGTNDPRYGLYAVAGSLHLGTRQGGNETAVRTMAGAFGVREAQVASGYETSSFSQNLFGGFRSSQGYRGNSDLARYSLSGKWFAKPSKGLKVGLIGRLFQMEAAAPGYLSQQQAAQDPRSFAEFSETDGGLQKNLHGSFHLDWDSRGDLFASAKAYHQRLSRWRWVRFTEAGSQQLRYQNEQQSGALGQLTYRPGAMWGVDDLAVSLGADVQYQDNVFRRALTDRRVVGEATRGQALDFFNASAFVQVDVHPIESLGIVLGARWDAFDGEFRDVLSGESPVPMLDFGSIWQPKASVVYAPARGYQLYANYGRTFQIPAGSGLYTEQELAWSKNDGVETGVKLAPSAMTHWQLAYFRQTASDEVHFVFNSSTDFENVGETLRHGLDLEGRVDLMPELGVWGSYTLQRSERRQAGANFQALRGMELDHVPRYLVKAGLEYRPLSSPLSLSAWLHAQGDYHLTTSYNYEVTSPDERYGGFALANLDATYRWERLTFGFHVTNLMNTRWNSAVWNNGAVNLFNPGPGRAALLSFGSSVNGG